MHIHALVPGGALKADGNWVAAKRGFLFPIQALSQVYRGKFVAALKAAHQGGKLRAEALRGDALLTNTAWGTLLARLYEHDWVVYARHSLGGPEQSLPPRKRGCSSIWAAIRIAWRSPTSASWAWTGTR